MFGRIRFSQDDTKRFHAACKAHGKTVTQVAAALCILANCEFTRLLEQSPGDDVDEEATSEKVTVTLEQKLMNLASCSKNRLRYLLRPRRRVFGRDDCANRSYQNRRKLVQYPRHRGYHLRRTFQPVAGGSSDHFTPPPPS